VNLKKSFLVTMILLPILLLTGCSNQKNDDETLKRKGIDELDYIDSKLISMINSMNNLSFENYEVTTREVPLKSKSSGAQEGSSSQSSSSSSGGGNEKSGKEQSEDQSSQDSESSSSSQEKATVSEMVSKSILLSDKSPKWDEAKKEIENFYTSWNAIVLDLYKLNIPSDSILSFNSTLDQATVAIKNEEKIAAVSALTSLYQHIPTYLQYMTDDSSQQNIKNTKYYVISAYSALESDDWDTTATELEKAIQNFVPIMNNSKYSETMTYGINKAYVILMELQTSIDLKDKYVFYINYRNLMEELNVL